MGRIQQLNVTNAAPVVAALSAMIHNRMQTWWHDPATGEPLKRNMGEMLMLAVSEVAEGLQDGMDDHLPKRSMGEVEMADTAIRILDICGGVEADLGGAYMNVIAGHPVEGVLFTGVKVDTRLYETPTPIIIDTYWVGTPYLINGLVSDTQRVDDGPGSIVTYRHRAMDIVAALSMAMEGHRKNTFCREYGRPMFDLCMAKALFLVFRLCQVLNYDLGGAIVEKMEYNEKRADHKPENRLKPGGKAY